MRRMDELHLDHPFAGSRMPRDLLRRECHNIGRRHVRSLMRKMGLQTLYRKPNLSKPATGQEASSPLTCQTTAKPHMLGFFRAYRMTTTSPTPDAWQRHITAWQHSGLSQKAYCQQHRLGLLTFHSKYRAIKNLGEPARHAQKQFGDDLINRLTK